MAVTKISRNIRSLANLCRMGTKTIVPRIKQTRMRKRSFELGKGVVGCRPDFMPSTNAVYRRFRDIQISANQSLKPLGEKLGQGAHNRFNLEIQPDQDAIKDGYHGPVKRCITFTLPRKDFF